MQPVPNPKFFSGVAYVCPVCGLAYETEIGLKTWCTPAKHALLASLENSHSMLDDIFLFRGREWHRFFTLTDRLWTYAMIEAKLCHEEANKHGYVPAHGCTKKDAPWTHRIGAPGEVGFCECFAGLPWKSNEGSYRKPDLLKRFGVRTGSKSHHRLWVYDEDDDDWVMVLILPTGRYREYYVVGWLFAREAKVLLPNGKPKYWEAPQKDRWAHYVPTAILHDWKLLPEMIEKAKETL